MLEVADPVEDLGALKNYLGENPVLVVDGLFGIGLNRDLDKHWHQFIQCINESNAPVLSVDCPSGLDAEMVRPRAVIEAAILYWVLKRGLLANSAAHCVGRLRIASPIGLKIQHRGGFVWVTEQDMRGLVSTGSVSHKGIHGMWNHWRFTGYHGAPILAGYAGLRAQPGLVSIFTPAYQPVSAQCQSIMVHPWDRDCVEALSRTTALVAGPGLAGGDVEDSLRQTVLNLWNESSKPMVVDASALDWLPKCSRIVRPFVCLHHIREAARLLGVLRRRWNPAECAQLVLWPNNLGRRFY